MRDDGTPTATILAASDIDSRVAAEIIAYRGVGYGVAEIADEVDADAETVTNFMHDLRAMVDAHYDHPAQFFGETFSRMRDGGR